MDIPCFEPLFILSQITEERKCAVHELEQTVSATGDVLGWWMCMAAMLDRSCGTV
jgi:NTP pyrophosphatase (non-canonical NTP hydrolase)